MPNISSFEALELEIKKTQGKPVTLEALWVNAPEGWLLNFKLYSEINLFFWKQKAVNDLGTILFSYQLAAPNCSEYEYPEAELARQLGRQAAEKYGIDFYFPAYEIPNDACPAWDKRHLAIPCYICQTPMLPKKQQSFKNICPNCI